MKYVLTEYASKNENPLKKLMRKMGIYKSFEIYDSEIFETEGYILTLPFLQEEIDDIEYCTKQIKAGLDSIRKECTDFQYCLPRELRALGGRDGENTSALLVCERFKDYTKDIDMKFASTAIIGNDIKLVLTVLDGIYDGLNSLCVLSAIDESLVEKAKEIYSETGLDVIFITNVKSPLFMEADIVINCGMDMSGCMNAVKKDALYISLKGNEIIKDEREDISFIDASEATVGGEDLDAAEIETVLCAKNYGYRNFVNSRYYRDKAVRARRAIKEELENTAFH